MGKYAVWYDSGDPDRDPCRPVYARFERHDKPILKAWYSAKTLRASMPFWRQRVRTSLVPVILMAMRAVAEMILPKATLSRLLPSSRATR